MNITLHRNTINHEEQQTVNARDLHAFLEVETRFNDWISRRIEEYGFIENQDFAYYSILSKTPDAAFSENSEKPQTGRPRVEYALSLEMAKELSMVERTDKGKQARAYFIEMERKAKQAAPALPDFTNPAIAARAWADEVEKNAEQQKRLAVAEPKAAALDLLADSKGASNITLTAKHLKMTRKELIGLLREKKWIWGTRPIQATQQVVNQGLMIQVTGISDRNGQPYTQALITPKGLAKLAVILQESNAQTQHGKESIMTNIKTENTKQTETKKTPPPPKKCLLAIGYPTDEPLTYRYETIGYFPTKTAAKKEIAERREKQPDLLFLILETNADPRAAVYQKFAGALEQ